MSTNPMTPCDHIEVELKPQNNKKQKKNPLPLRLHATYVLVVKCFVVVIMRDCPVIEGVPRPAEPAVVDVGHQDAPA